MKLKVGIFALLALGIFLILFSHLANSQGDDAIPGEISGITNTSDKIAGIVTNPSEQNGSALLQEWRKIFMDNPVGIVLVKIWDFSKPILSFIIGTNANISWKFAIAIAIWIGLLFLFGNTFIMVSPFSKSTGWIISVGMVIIMALTKIIDLMAGALDKLAGKWWGKLIILVAIIAIIYFYSMVGKSTKEKKEKERLEEDKEKLHAAANAAESFAKGAGI